MENGLPVKYLYSVREGNFYVHVRMDSSSAGKLEGVFESEKAIPYSKGDTGEIKVPRGLQKQFEEKYEGKFKSFKKRKLGVRRVVSELTDKWREEGSLEIASEGEMEEYHSKVDKRNSDLKRGYTLREAGSREYLDSLGRIGDF